MMLEQLSILPVILIALCSVVLLVSQNWRYSILALAIQYVGLFWLVGTIWPFGLAAVKLVAGWMAGAVLSASQPEEGLQEDQTAGLGRAAVPHPGCRADADPGDSPSHPASRSASRRNKTCCWAD